METEQARTTQLIYREEPDLTAEAFVDVLERSGLAARRPVDDLERIRRMLAHADLILCARAGERLIGVARTISDFAYCAYLSDLAVDRAYQRQGIGKELIRRSHEILGEEVMLLLLSAPAAHAYYPHIGFAKADNAWFLPRQR
ncbi:MAG TPA: GNAT family N-acetyltransferase [Chthonomonadaceae bacterium]|nr:GNAT family N-acetyltransferase [Chthonomonadaceae bacterium]